MAVSVFSPSLRWFVSSNGAELIVRHGLKGGPILALTSSSSLGWWRCTVCSTFCCTGLRLMVGFPPAVLGARDQADEATILQ